MSAFTVVCIQPRLPSMRLAMKTAIKAFSQELLLEEEKASEYLHVRPDINKLVLIKAMVKVCCLLVRLMSAQR